MWSAAQSLNQMAFRLQGDSIIQDLHDLAGSVADPRSLPSGFRSEPGHVTRVFRISFCPITFGGQLAYLAYHRHKRGCKTSDSIC